ncbi:RHS repeat-associated core domain-containing protein [archaeon]|nr:RHS repeat-associated core domain-containing protein [archaeon]
MRYYISIFIILLIVSQVTAVQLENINEFRFQEKYPIKNITINNTQINDTLNITNNSTINFTNITINQTEPINITNTTLIITPINFTNITILNLTKPINKTLNLTNITINQTEPINITNTTNKTLFLSPPKLEGKKTTYFYAGNKLLASKENDEIKYHYQDRLGTDINSKTLPFGQEISNEERFSFTGKELDQSNLHNFNARAYDSKIGKFTSKDSEPRNNPYSYVNDKPLNYIDPDGKDPITYLFTMMGISIKLNDISRGNLKEKAIEEGINQGVKVTQNAIENIDPQKIAPPSKKILKGGLGVVSELVIVGASNEENKGRLLVKNIAEETTKTILMPGKKEKLAYELGKQFCKDGMGPPLRLSSSSSILNPETIQILKEIYPDGPKRPVNDFRLYPSLKRANEAAEQKWITFLAGKDTLPQISVRILKRYGVKVDLNNVIVIK